MQKLRALFLGDEQVGKTSIIRCFVTQNFPSDVPSCNPPISIPSELSSSKTSITIIDTFCIFYTDRKGQDIDYIHKELKKANIIVLVFDITRAETLKRVIAFWLPLIRDTTAATCVLVGNKIDLQKSSQNLEEVSKKITESFPQCQIMIETTAKSFISIKKMFEIAEQAVVFPTHALYNPTTYELTEDYQRALQLIFRLCDEDGDLRLNNEELCKFNKSVFNVDLSLREIEKTKMLIKESCVDGIDHMGVTLNGFISINKAFIKKFKPNNSWMILEHFGFDHNLERKIEININLNEGQVIELSEAALMFLVKLFKRYSTHDVLTDNGINQICATIKTKPWYPYMYQEMIPCVNNSVSAYSWLALWHLLMYQSPISTLASLNSLGYPYPISTSYTIYQRSNLKARKLHICVVLGHKKVGKKLLLSKFLYKNPEEKVLPTVCGSIEENEEIHENNFLLLTKNNEEKFPDVVCLVYDGSSYSQNFIKKLNVELNIPKILLLNRNDSNDHESAYSFALELGLRECPQFNLRSQRPNTLFKQLNEYAIDPKKGIFRKNVFKGHQKQNNSIGSWVLGGLGLAALAFMLMKKPIKVKA